MKGLIDSTLREGEQTPFVSFSLEEKINIALLLMQVGIEEIELGIATPLDQELPKLLTACRSHNRNQRLALWCRCKEEDIRYAADLHPDALSLSIPASDLHINDKLGRSRIWAQTAMENAVRLALDLGISIVSVGLEDATRADENFLEELIDTARLAGVTRIRLADTVGIASPTTMGSLIRRITTNHPVEIGVHTHNDFGMATANAIAAFESGAHWADATVLGLGERAGNSRLEEMAGYLTLIKQKRHYKMHHLRTLCHAVSHASARPIPSHHPLMGESIFTCETGLHLQGLARNPTTYEPYAPELVGGSRKMLVGRKAGRRAVKDKLKSLGYGLPPEKTDYLVHLIRIEATKARRPLNDEEIQAMAGI